MDHCKVYAVLCFKRKGVGFQEELDAITEKLAKLEAPTLNSAAKADANGVYQRLTDHTKYTGAHKERFDAEGKGEVWIYTLLYKIALEKGRKYA